MSRLHRAIMIMILSATATATVPYTYRGTVGKVGCVGCVLFCCKVLLLHKKDRSVLVLGLIN